MAGISMGTSTSTSLSSRILSPSAVSRTRGYQIQRLRRELEQPLIDAGEIQQVSDQAIQSINGSP